MSLGYGGRTVKFGEDGTQIIFSYGVYNLNIENSKDLKLDGFITINKNCFDILDDGIFYLVKRGKKLKTEINFDKLYAEIYAKDKIIIENCLQTWQKVQDIDFIAILLIDKIFNNYLLKNDFAYDVSINK